MFSVKLLEISQKFNLKYVYKSSRIDRVEVTTSDINRPGLQLAGFFNYFGSERVQVLGKVEYTYLKELSPKERFERLDNYFRFDFPCMVVCRGLPVFAEIKEAARKYDVSVLKTEEITSRFASSLTHYLNKQLAPRTSKHGVLVEVYGEGILILGESGVGKSETALELIKRGHRLIADDIVEVRKVAENTLVGFAPEIIRHLMEIRGIGVLDIKTLFGVGSVKTSEKIDMVINLEFWDESKQYDRLGMADNYMDILGVGVPLLNVPVRPGRNLAVVIEVASINNRQRKMGYNAAKELNEKIMKEIRGDRTPL